MDAYIYSFIRASHRNAIHDDLARTVADMINTRSWRVTNILPMGLRGLVFDFDACIYGYADDVHFDFVLGSVGNDMVFLLEHPEYRVNARNVVAKAMTVWTRMSSIINDVLDRLSQRMYVDKSILASNLKIRYGIVLHHYLHSPLPTAKAAKVILSTLKKAGFIVKLVEASYPWLIPIIVATHKERNTEFRISLATLHATVKVEGTTPSDAREQLENALNLSSRLSEVLRHAAESNS